MSTAAYAADDGDVMDRVVAAARGLFAVHGVSGTRMEDVARVAGISRQYLYRFVNGRDELIEMAILARLRELGDELIHRAEAGGDDVEGAIADMVIAGSQSGQNDLEFVTLAGAMNRARLNTLLMSRLSPLHDITSQMFGPSFARASAAGRLRTDVTVDSMIGWLQGVMTMLAGRDDLDDDEMRAMVRDFVLRSLTR